MTRLIIGLGNPGETYARTRHNAGWLAIDRFASRDGFSTFTFDKKFRADIATGTIDGEKIILAKPQTFMNLSGESARALIDFYKLAPMDVIATYDDKDLPFGTLRLRADGGAGGHNGVKSIIAHLGTDDFTRVRIGVANDFTARTPTDVFVLADFSTEECAALPNLTRRAADAIISILKNGLAVASNEFN